MSKGRKFNLSLKRWFDLLICAIVTSIIVLICSKTPWIQKIYFWLGTVINSFPIEIQWLFSFILGVGLTHFLKTMYIYNDQRFLGFSFKYPPLTISVSFTLVLLTSYSAYIEPDLYVLNEVKISTLTYPFIALLLGLLSSPFVSFTNLVCKKITKWLKVLFNKKGGTQNNEIDLKTYEDFTAWFATDEPINNIDDLERDYHTYVTRIFERISPQISDSQKSTHIALCGEYGVGKSSIIKCVVNKLDKRVFIHCNIDCWAIDKESIAEVVLQHIITQVHKKLDMSAFRKLPAHYSAALNTSNNSLKILSIFLNQVINPTKELKRLNDVLALCNYKVLITIQDLDRSNDALPKLNNLAALLNELKTLESFSFIIAIENNPKFSEVIRKVVDYREDVIKIDFKSVLSNYLHICMERSFDENLKKPSLHFNGTYKDYLEIHPLIFSKNINIPLHQINEIIPSHRVLKDVLRRVNSIWDKTKLMGEIDLEILVLITALREIKPAWLDVLQNNYNLLSDRLSLPEVKSTGKNISNNDLNDMLNEICNDDVLFKKILLNLLGLNLQGLTLSNKGSNSANPINIPDPIKEILKYYKLNITSGESDLIKYKPSTFVYEQTLNHPNSKYFKRALLENVPINEVRDQTVIKDLHNAKNGDFDALINNLLDKEKNNNYEETFYQFECLILDNKQKVYEDFFLSTLTKENLKQSSKYHYMKWLYQSFFIALTPNNFNNLTVALINHFNNEQIIHFFSFIRDRHTSDESTYLDNLEKFRGHFKTNENRQLIKVIVDNVAKFSREAFCTITNLICFPDEYKFIYNTLDSDTNYSSIITALLFRNDTLSAQYLTLFLDENIVNSIDTSELDKIKSHIICADKYDFNIDILTIHGVFKNHNNVMEYLDKLE